MYRKDVYSASGVHLVDIYSGDLAHGDVQEAEAESLEAAEASHEQGERGD